MLHCCLGLLMHLKYQSAQTCLPHRGWDRVSESGIGEKVSQLLRHRYTHHLLMFSSCETDICHILRLGQLGKTMTDTRRRAVAGNIAHSPRAVGGMVTPIT